MAGKLFLVATPIGNLEDVTIRGLKTLRTADLILCEDTRITQRLLNRYKIRRPLLSYHKFNESLRVENILTRLRNGQNIALVSNAGTPLISDPGSYIVLAAISEQIPVVPIPGASAILPAICAAGVQTPPFHFFGFLPRENSAKKAWLEQIDAMTGGIVLYESPQRVMETLKTLHEVLGNIQIVLAREMTKIHEEFIRGPISDVLINLSQREIRGEFVIVFERQGNSVKLATVGQKEAVFRALLQENPDFKEAIAFLKREYGWSKRELYQIYLQIKGSV